MTDGGKFGHEQENETRKVLFSFLCIHQATICNTWFMKKEIYKKIWQHSGNKCWHCIDCVIVHWIYINKCIDVSMRTGVKYNTDYLLVYAEMKLKRRPICISNHEGRVTKRGLICQS